ncbi:MAG: zinc ribbon domain-containing protein [Candidatus Zixiibacteriota bacterium]
MPTYEYQCTECGHEFEAFQTISEAPVTSCPICRGRVERKISGGAGFLFKGSGFYITDYRSKDYKSAEAKEKGGKIDTSKDTAGKPKSTSRSKEA